MLRKDPPSHRLQQLLYRDCVDDRRKHPSEDQIRFEVALAEIGGISIHYIPRPSIYCIVFFFYGTYKEKDLRSHVE